MSEGWTSEARPLDTSRILKALHDHGVEYVIVGGIAALLHRWSGSTADLDLVPADRAANLNRLGSALLSLGAKIWADPARTDLLAGGKPPEADDFGFTAEGLSRAKVWHLMSDAGPIDVAFEIEAEGGYASLLLHAEERTVFGLKVKIASLEQIISSKRALARPKDLRVLPELEDLLDQRARDE